MIMPHALLRRTATVVLALSISLPAASQVPAERRLAPATGQLSEEFISITSIRELSDGRVLITDPRVTLWTGMGVW